MEPISGSERSPIPPKIMFVEELQIGRMVTKFAYLVRIDGQPYAYADLREVHLLPDKANVFPLDPSRIVEETNSETGQKNFAYRGTV